ncbi:MAG: AIR synthase-related protein, partial [Chloroflexota bacterium]
DAIVGMQDLGAAGLTSSAVEAAAKAGTGLVIDVGKVPRRETGMTPYEVMLAESQERMLLMPRPGYESRVEDILRRWELPYAYIGQVTNDGLARIREGDEVLAQVPVSLLTHPPRYVYQATKPDWLAKLQELESPADLSASDCPEVLLRLLASPNIASKESVYRQYDHEVGINTVIRPGADAALLRIKGTSQAIALSTDGNGRYCYLDPYRGGALAVAEAARNVVCVGARPIALTNCLNLGNPERPDIYYQLKDVIRGMARACRALKVPVISGNVSLYNETQGQAIYPTPVVGMLGLVEDINRRCTPGFKAEGDIVFLLGREKASLDGSEYLELIHGQVKGRPTIDLDLETRVQACCLEGISQGLLRSAHDCSDGGLAVALAECSIFSGLGFRGEGERKGRLDEHLFGEAPSRIVVSVAPQDISRLAELASTHQVPLTRLGQAGGDRFSFHGLLDLPLLSIAHAWRTGLGKT